MAVDQQFHWPCAQCGADLRFAPGQTELVCDHCGHRQKVAARDPAAHSGALVEHDLSRGLANELPGSAIEEVRSTSCPNCGAVVEFSGARHATECPFCASPLAVDTGTRRLIKPQALIPFAITEREARDRLKKWLGSLWFAPSALLEFTRAGRAMTGVYCPFWSFDADTASRYTGQRGEHYYETRTVTRRVNGKSQTSQERVQKTRWYPASGRVARTFDDLLVMAATSLPEHLGDALAPWDLGRLTAYSPDFLAGFQAEAYTVDLRAGRDSGHDKMQVVIHQDVRQDIGGDVQRVTSVDTSYSNETFKHILLPIWTAAYKYNGKSFRFLVNGQTGEVQGERPWSIWKIGFAVLAVVVIVLGGVYLNDPTALGLPRPEWMN